jgi:hypothetical protein
MTMSQKMNTSSVAYYLRLSSLIRNMSANGWTVSAHPAGGFRIVRGPAFSCS